MPFFKCAYATVLEDCPVAVRAKADGIDVKFYHECGINHVLRLKADKGLDLNKWWNGIGMPLCQVCASNKGKNLNADKTESKVCTKIMVNTNDRQR